MSPRPENFTRIPLQVGSELRISNRGELIINNPTVEAEPALDVASAVLDYRFDEKTGEHILRLIEPTRRRRRQT